MSGLDADTPVRYWPGFRDGPSKVGRISAPGVHTVGGTRCQYIIGAGAVSLAHIEALPFENGLIHVETVAEAMQVCDWEGVEDVNITDNAERLKLQRVISGLRIK